MSHFLVGVILPKDTDNIQSGVDVALEPYDENLEVEEYDRDCSCAKWEAHRKATDRVTEVLGRSFGEHKNAYSGLAKDEQPDWSEWIAPYIKLEDKLTQKFLKTQPPVADCEECKGTGKFKSTYNPDSKWDWYRIGGRWNGIISKEGKAINDKDGGFNFDPEFEKPENNSVLLKDLPKKNRDYIFAFITPDGEWVQSAEMGWWGMTSDDVDPKDWKKTVSQIFKDYGDYILVGVDCHI